MGLDTVELIVLVERRFDIRIANALAENIVTVGDLQDVAWQCSIAEHGAAFTMSRTALNAAVVQLVEEIAGVGAANITPGKSLTSDLGLD